MTIKEKIKETLENALPMVDTSSDFLFSELDSLSITALLAMLSDEYGIQLDSSDATAKNFMSLDSIANLVETKLKEKQ